MDHLLSSLFGKKEVDSHLPQREGMKRVYLWQGMLGLSLSSVGPSTDFFFQSIEREHFRRAPRNMTKYTTSRSHWREHLSKSYLMGAMHDGTIRRRTLRICQREESYVLFLRDMIRRLGFGAWCYREGKTRELYVVEFSRAVLESHMVRTRRDKIDYVRGYFDAEGGLPSKRNSEPYIYFAQKNKKDLGCLRGILLELGIECGCIHNPSAAVDPGYWRFYLRRRSLLRFVLMIGSWHPRKSPLLTGMLKSTG